MQKILFKRSIRNLKSNLFSYIALFLLILLCMIMVVANNTAADTVIQRTIEIQEENCVEDGNITAILPFTQEQEKQITDKGITLEKTFSQDFAFTEEATLRIFANRENVDKLSVIKGRKAESDDEIAIEKHFANAHKLSIDDTITLGGKELKVVGFVTSPDYETVVPNSSTSFTNAYSFGTSFLTPSGYQALVQLNKGKSSEIYNYAYLLNDKLTDDELEELIKTFPITLQDIEASNIEISSMETIFLLTQSKLGFLQTAEENLRIKSAANDQVANKQTGILAGIIILILFSYVLSVFISHEITEDSAVIGTLYSLGVRRRDLVLHYLYLPVFITFLGGVMGYLIGIIGPIANVQIQNCYDYFSIPELKIAHSAYLIIYSMVLPPLISIAVNFIVIYRKLNRPALSLIRKESKVKKSNSKVKLNKLNFTHKFQLRQFARESKASVAVIIGMFICTVVLMLSLDCMVMCYNLRNGAEQDVKFNYAYTYKFPTEEAPEGAYEAYGETFNREIFGYKMDLTLLGITEDNPYFDVDVPDNKNEVIISDSLAQKFQVKIGDTLTFDREKEYSFKVVGITKFSPSFYMFMDIDMMREMFKKDDAYFNVVFSDTALEVPSKNLYSVTQKEEAIAAAQVVVDIMEMMIWSLMILAIIIFVVVMYMMMKMMLDKSRQNISLLTVMGYTPKEVRKLYLDGNFFVIMLSSIITIPLAKVTMDAVYPAMCANVASGIDIVFPWWFYPVIFLTTMVLYVIINALLVTKIKKITPAETIQNRE